MLGARERGRDDRAITRPNMVLPASAHAAFEKAAHYFGVESRRIPVGEDWRAEPGAMAAAVDGDTVLVVASAPQYPQGVVDPVGEITAIAAGRGISCHVDACMGGVALPYLERLGHAVAPFDFRVDGVTSISVDLHKFAYAAKGASVILWRAGRPAPTARWSDPEPAPIGAAPCQSGPAPQAPNGGNDGSSTRASA